MLNQIHHGAPGGTPLIIVHGLYGSARNWGVIGKRLSENRHVIAVDQRNHGDSPWHDSHSYPDMAADLAAVIDANGGRADVVGHSMGAGVACLFAATFPERVSRLVLIEGLGPPATAADEVAPNLRKAIDQMQALPEQQRKALMAKACDLYAREMARGVQAVAGAKGVNGSADDGAHGGSRKWAP